MKTLRFFLLRVFFAASAPLRFALLWCFGFHFSSFPLPAQGATPAHPAGELLWTAEDYDAGEGKIWRTVKFTTIPGMLYTLQSSADLKTWQDYQTFYGLGHELGIGLFPVKEPPPPEPQEGDPPVPPAEFVPLVMASVRLDPLAGNAGTLLSFRSLDDGIAIRFPITETLSADWPRYPFWAQRFGTHDFYLSGSFGEMETPAETTAALGPKDAAMVAALRAHLPEIETQMAANLQRGLETTPPPPREGNKHFYRLRRISVDTDGDGIYDQDEMYDGLSSAFSGDTDGDGIPDAAERAAGTNPSSKHSDNDSIEDALDADPLDTAVCWYRCAESRYAVVELPHDLPANAVPIDLGEGGHVLAISPDPSDIDWWWEQWPGEHPSPANGATYVWKPGAASWGKELSELAYRIPIGFSITPDGTVLGNACQALVDENGNPRGGPGNVVVPGKWPLAENGGYEAFFMDWSGDDFGETGFAAEGGGLNVPIIGGPEKLLPLSFGPQVFTYDYSKSTANLKLAGGAVLETFHGNSGPPPHSIEAAGGSSGWFAYRIVMADENATTTRQTVDSAGNKHPGPAGSGTLMSFAAIDPALVPQPPVPKNAQPGDDPPVKPDVLVWTEESTSDGNGGQVHPLHVGKHASGAMDWTSSSRPEDKRLKGKVNARGEGLSGSKLWRNGRWIDLKDLLPEGYTLEEETNPGTVTGTGGPLAAADPSGNGGGNPTPPAAPLTVTGIDINDNGTILVKITQGEVERFSILTPLWVDGVDPTVTPPDLEAHHRGVDNTSIRADKDIPGNGNLSDMWIMAPLARTNTVRFRSAASSTFPLYLSCEKATFTPSVLTSPDQQIIVAGSGAESQDAEVVVRAGGSSGPVMKAPLKVKIMKKRTVKVTVHPVTSTIPALPDSSPPQAARTISPTVVPDKQMIEEYLAKIFPPQLNADITVTVKPIEELQWDFADHADGPWKNTPGAVKIKPWNGELDFMGDDVQPDKPLGPEEKYIEMALKDSGADINIYILGGAKMYGWQVSGSTGMLEPGTALYAFTKLGPNAIFVNGNPEATNRRAGVEDLPQMLQTIAHEIGHCMVGKGHPDADPILGGSPGIAPHRGIPAAELKFRLMHTTEPGKQLVKLEWDEAEPRMKERPDKRYRKEHNLGENEPTGNY